MTTRTREATGIDVRDVRMKPATDITEFPPGAMALPPLVDRAARRAVAAAAAAATDVSPPSLARDVYELTKPRMNALVVVTTGVGFYAAVPGVRSVDGLLLL